MLMGEFGSLENRSMTVQARQSGLTILSPTDRPAASLLKRANLHTSARSLPCPLDVAPMYVCVYIYMSMYTYTYSNSKFLSLS